jgi:transposase-like protein
MLKQEQNAHLQQEGQQHKDILEFQLQLYLQEMTLIYTFTNKSGQISIIKLLLFLQLIPCSVSKF